MFLVWKCYYLVNVSAVNWPRSRSTATMFLFIKSLIQNINFIKVGCALKGTPELGVKPLRRINTLAAAALFVPDIHGTRRGILVKAFYSTPVCKLILSKFNLDPITRIPQLPRKHPIREFVSEDSKPQVKRYWIPVQQTIGILGISPNAI